VLKRRLIAVLLFRDGVLTRTKNFVPDYIYTKNQVNVTDCDELCCINLGGDWGLFRDAVNHVADEAMLPLTVGGGIDCMDLVSRCFGEMPADKIVIGPRLTRELSDSFVTKYGAQSLVAGITEGKAVPYWADSGELLIQSVERDGSLRGYPLEFAERFMGAGIPVVLGSGCEGYRSMLKGFEAGADACSTSNIFHFTPSGMKGIKRALLKRGVPIRDDNLQAVSDAGHAPTGAIL